MFISHSFTNDFPPHLILVLISASKYTFMYLLSVIASTVPHVVVFGDYDLVYDICLQSLRYLCHLDLTTLVLGRY